MGLDDLSWIQFLPPMLGLLVTVVVSGPASVVSHVAWKWSLARIAEQRAVGPARVLSVVALVATGAPVAYCVPLTVVPLGLGGNFGLVCVTALAAAALVHAAYRAECIREVADNRELSAAFLRNPYAGDRQAQLDEAATGVTLPSFVGATRRRSLILAFVVFLAWGLVAALLALRAATAR